MSLAVALRLPGQEALQGWAVYLVMAACYLANGYYALVGTAFAQQIIKRFQKRLDFSVDIFSPHLDLPKHIVRRIKQETFSTILLAEPAYKIKDAEAILTFGTIATERTQESLPPYLLHFQGAAGERHVENLKILRQIGMQRYIDALQQHNSEVESLALRQLQETIQRYYTGPDCFWLPDSTQYEIDGQSFFGRTSILPFPYTLIFYYDEGKTPSFIRDRADLQEYLRQNTSTEIIAARNVRQAIRALENKKCYLPRVGSRTYTRWSRIFNQHSEDHEEPVLHDYGVLRIARNSQYCWKGYNYNSGFRITMEYRDGRQLTREGKERNGISFTANARTLGITPSYQLTPELARLFQLNRVLLHDELTDIKSRLDAHQAYFAEEAWHKQSVLSYNFLVSVYGNDALDKETLDNALQSEYETSVRQLADRNSGAIDYTLLRMQAVQRDFLCQWWYLAWDDLWRRNYQAISAMVKHEADFSPHYRTSICYRPMTRASLEDFLAQRGLWGRSQRRFFNNGVLNRIYFYLDEMLFHGTAHSIRVKVGRHRHQVDFHELDRLKPFDMDDSFGNETMLTYDTGQGTDHDEDFTRNRPPWAFEELYDQRATSLASGRNLVYFRQRAWEKLQEWLGWRSYERSSKPPGLYFSLRESTASFQAPKCI